MTPRRKWRNSSGADAQLLNWVLVGLVWLSPLSASAQSSDAAAARTLFQEARKAADAGDYTTACPKFADSYQLDPAVGTLLNVADCEQRLGHLAEAWARFQKAIDQLPKTDDRRSAVEKMTADLEKRLPHLTIRLTPVTPRGAVVERDGAPVVSSSLGVALPVDPGHHVVVVKVAGHQERRFEVDVAEGESKLIQGEPGPSLPPIKSPTVVTPLTTTPKAKVNGVEAQAVKGGTGPHSPQPARQQQRLLPSQPISHSRTSAYIVGGVGAAGIVVGIITRALAFGQKSTISGHCNANKACDATGLDAVSSASTYQTVSTVSLLIGLAGIGTGVYLAIGDSEKPAAQATLQPMVLPMGTGLSIRRAF